MFLTTIVSLHREKILIVKLTFFVCDLALHQPYEPKWHVKIVLSVSLFSVCYIIDTFLKLILAYISIFPFDFIFLLDNDLQCNLPNISLVGKLLSISYCVTSMISFKTLTSQVISCNQCKILKNTYFEKYMQLAASENLPITVILIFRRNF